MALLTQPAIPPCSLHLLQGLANMKAVGIARLQHCSLVIVPEGDPSPAGIRVSTFVLMDD